MYPERDYQTLHEFIHQARLSLPQTTWDYLTGGAETETTQVRNRLAIEVACVPAACVAGCLRG